jgi:hypothetical protein
MTQTRPRSRPVQPVDQRRDAHGAEGSNRSAEAYRLARMPPPIIAIEAPSRRKRLACQVRQESDARLSIGDPLGPVLKRIEHRGEPVRMERMRDVEHPAADTDRSKVPHGIGHRVGVAGNHRFLRTVDCGDGEAVRPPGKAGAHPPFIGEHGSHAAARG